MSSRDSVREMDLVAVATAVAVAEAVRMVVVALVGLREGREASFFSRIMTQGRECFISLLACGPLLSLTSQFRYLFFLSLLPYHQRAMLRTVSGTNRPAAAAAAVRPRGRSSSVVVAASQRSGDEAAPITKRCVLCSPRISIQDLEHFLNLPRLSQISSQRSARCRVGTLKQEEERGNAAILF